MTTEIESFAAVFKIDGSQGLPSGSRPGISIESKWRDAQVGGNFNREDIIAAVETELGGVFIEKTALPPVSLDHRGRAVAGGFTLFDSDTTESLQKTAYAFLALAQYREENPPVDPQVTVLTGLLVQSLTGSFTPQETAEKLIATGKITVDTTL